MTQTGRSLFRHGKSYRQPVAPFAGCFRDRHNRTTSWERLFLRGSWLSSRIRSEEVLTSASTASANSGHDFLRALGCAPRGHRARSTPRTGSWSATKGFTGDARSAARSRRTYSAWKSPTASSTSRATRERTTPAQAQRLRFSRHSEAKVT